MGSLPLTSKSSFFITTTQFPFFSSSSNTRRRTTTTTTTVFLNQRKNYKVFASSSRDEDKNTPQLDNYDLMELKFGRLLGEDPKLTLAKVHIILIFNFVVFVFICIRSDKHHFETQTHNCSNPMKIYCLIISAYKHCQLT